MTGFYLIVRDLDLEVIKEVVKDVYSQIASWDQEIPGAKEEECGNYTFMDLAEAKKAANYFVNLNLSQSNKSMSYNQIGRASCRERVSSTV